eukprot:1242782-Pyramimonas_sp.AAC.3
MYTTTLTCTDVSTTRTRPLITRTFPTRLAGDAVGGEDRCGPEDEGVQRAHHQYQQVHRGGEGQVGDGVAEGVGPLRAGARHDQSSERKEFIPGGGTDRLRGKSVYLEGGPVDREERVYTWRGDQSTERKEYASERRCSEKRLFRIRTQAVSIAADKEEAETALVAAIPALEAAADALQGLKKEEITEIRSFVKPPPVVQKVCECVVILRNIKDVSWKGAKGMMADPRFLSTLIDFDKDALTDRQVPKRKMPNPSERNTKIQKNI